MMVTKTLQQTLAWIACFGILLPLHLVQADDTVKMNLRPAQLVDDVALELTGRLNGRVLESDGRAMSDTGVTLFEGNEPLADTTTDAEGVFHFDGVSGGVYRLVAVKQSVMIRAWSNDAAPPSARGESWIVAGDLVRGQGCTNCGSAGCSGCGGGPMSWLLSPWVIGAAIAAAIAIPLALDDDDGS